MLKLSGRWAIGFAIAAGFATAVTGIVILRSAVQSNSPASTPSPAITPAQTPDAISALGRLEPAGEVVQLAAPSTLGSARITKLTIKDGDLVKQGQVVAEMDSYDRLYAAVIQAEAEVKEAESRLAQVLAGAKRGEIAAQRAEVTRIQVETNEQVSAQRATIARLESELRIAQREFQRNQTLYQEGAISASALDLKRLDLETAEARLREAQANLKQIEVSARERLSQARSTLESVAEVRPTDIRQAEAQVEVAAANLQRAQAELDNALVRSPITGKVLKVHAKTGEQVGNEGIAELGRTSQMYAVAEVYETEIDRVKVGQKALISSPAFSGEISGQVKQVGLQIRKKDVLDTDPAADTDARVVEVKVELDNSQKVAGLTNLQVDIKIFPE